MGNVIVVSGGVNAPIVAGASGSNGASFPIKYFLLGYDPAIDPTIHSIAGATSATPFNETVLSGDSSLIQRGGYHIFASKQYSVSTKKFLILKGTESKSGNTITSSDKTNALPITLDATTGRVMINSISATNDNDLYTTGIGVWNCPSASTSAAGLDDSSLLNDKINYFNVSSYFPIVNPTGDKMRGVYKCRVDSGYGEFIFNKIGLYMLPTGETKPVLVAVAHLNNPITKRKTGTSVTNVEFDIELEFNLTSGSEPIAYMTADYWSKIPTSGSDVSGGYGLFTDKNIVIGTSGQGWPARKAKVEVVTMGEKPALCLHNRYNENYMLFDVLKNQSLLPNTTLSGSSYLRIYTDAPNSAGSSLNVYVNRYIPTGSTTYARTGIYTSINSKDVGNNDIRGNVVSIFDINDVKVVKGFESNISEHKTTTALKTYGFYSTIDSTLNDISNCDKYGYYANVSGKGKALYGIYAEVNPSTSAAPVDGSIAGYFKSPYTNSCYALRTKGNSYFDGGNTFANNYNISNNEFAVYITSTGSSTASVANIYGLYSKVIKGLSAKAYAGYFESDDVAIQADGNCNFNGLNIVNGYLSIFNSTSDDITDDVIFNVHGKSGFINDITVMKKMLTQGNIGTSYYASNILVDTNLVEKRPHDKTGFITPVGTIVAWATTTPPDGWKICNGELLLREGVYNELYTVLGSTFNDVDELKFKLPDYRGYFLRGLETSETPSVETTENRSIGSIQSHALQAHNHYIPVKGEAGGQVQAVSQSGGGGGVQTNVNKTETVFNSGNTSTETRPINKAVNWIIKY